MTNEQYERAIEIKNQIKIFEDYISTIVNAITASFEGGGYIALVTNNYNLKKNMTEYFTNRIDELEKEFEEL